MDRLYMAGTEDRKIDHGAQAAIVLVVEDDDDCREVICETLRDASYVVIEAADAEEALRILLAEDGAKPQIIVTDLRLPGMSGLELIDVLGTHDRLCHVAVVLMSASRPWEAGAEEGAHWLEKPFDAEDLVSAVNEQRSALRGGFS
jgi:two-component system OmpR family response regulator